MFLLVFWKCDETRSFVFNVLHISYVIPVVHLRDNDKMYYSMTGLASIQDKPNPVLS